MHSDRHTGYVAMVKIAFLLASLLIGRLKVVMQFFNCLAGNELPAIFNLLESCERPWPNLVSAGPVSSWSFGVSYKCFLSGWPANEIVYSVSPLP